MSSDDFENVPETTAADFSVDRVAIWQKLTEAIHILLDGKQSDRVVFGRIKGMARQVIEVVNDWERKQLELEAKDGK